MSRLVYASALAMCAFALGGCGDDNEAIDAAVPDAFVQPADANLADAGGLPSVERGEYLVKHVGVCGGCHTPRDQTGAPIAGMFLSGVDCFVDAVPSNPNMGCLSTRNLTNDASGLMTRTDEQIKNMFRNGVRPDGTFMVPVMPYYVFHNMTDVDADSVVRFLRTVPAVAHTVAATQAPFTNWPAASAALDPADIPTPSTVNEHTMNGRYLATMAGVCIECHTVRTNPQQDPGSLDKTKFFAGGEEFPAAAFGLPVPPFPAIIYSANITPDASGLQGITQDLIVRELHMGLDKDGKGICPPMPVGPMGEYGGLTDADANDIAAYVLALPPIANTVPNGCVVPSGP